MDWWQDFTLKYNDTLKKLQGINNRDSNSLLDSDMTMDGSGFKALLKDRPDGSPLYEQDASKESKAIKVMREAIPNSIFFMYI